MHNLGIGLVLIGLALLVGAVVLVYHFAPEIGLSPASSMEVKSPDDEESTLQVTVGGEKTVEDTINDDARYKQSMEYAREIVDGQTRGLTRSEHESLDERRQFQHKVVRGETLSSLAREYLGDEKLWQAILDVNPALHRPEDLREGQTITIPLREAK